MVFCYATPLLFFGRQLASLLSGGVPEVEQAYLSVLPLILAMQYMDGLFNVFKTWLVIRKQQAFGAVMSIVIYYGVGVPLGFCLAFWQDLGLLGLWAGLGVAVFLGCVITGVQATLDLQKLGEEDEEVDSSYRALPDSPASLSGDKLARTSAWRFSRYLRLLSLLVPGTVAVFGCVAWRKLHGAVIENS